jgi:hypothetical protein
MPTVVTVTAEVEALGECGYCGQAMAISPVLHGIELNGSYVCDPCFFYRFNGSRAQAAQALGRGAEEDDDGPDGDGGPAAPAARPTLWLIVNGQAVPRELSPEEEREWDDFLRAVEEDRERCPLEECQTCRRPSSPLVEGDCLHCRGELALALELELPPTPGGRTAAPVLAALATVTR